MIKYITKDDTIIFGPSFNECLDHQLLTNYQRIIFSDYHLCYKLFDAYKNNKLTKIKNIMSKFNHPIDSLPSSGSSITHLTFGTNFNQPVNALPPSITHLTFDRYSKFNHPVDSLPSSITHLTFGDYSKFNHPVSNLPSSITHLTFGINFNQPVDSIPSSITHLTIGSEFNQPVNALPSSIQYLTFDKYSEFNQSLDNLPKFIELIELPFKYKLQISNLPPKLRIIKCSNKYPYINDFAGLQVIKYD